MNSGYTSHFAESILTQNIFELNFNPQHQIPLPC